MSNKACVVKIKKGGVSLEILCKPGTVEKYRDGKIGFDNCVLSDEMIFSNSQKMTRAKESDIKKLCNGLSGRLAVEYILREGEYSLTTAEIREKTEAKRREIVNYLVKYYHDAAKKPPIPHPISRFESVLKEMRYNVDYQRETEEQIKEILKKLADFVPITPVNPPHLERESQAREQHRLNREAIANEKSNDRGGGGNRGKKGKNKSWK